jgi:hypothetical protein
MKRLFLFLQWGLLIGAAAVAIFFTFRPKPAPVYDPASWKSWEGFFVLSYAGIIQGENPAYTSSGRLKEQLQALKEAGYQTIKLADALAFLQGKSPLPEKALLLLFEGDRKDSFIRATPYLEKFGFFGNLCVPTKLTQSWGNFFLKEGELKKVSQHPNWDMVSMGHQAIEQIPLDAKGTEGHFLSQRLWLGGKKEDDEAFRRRLLADYDKSADLLNHLHHRRVIAYLYPYTDAGTGAGSDPLAADLNRSGVEARYLMAFTQAGNPFNGPRSQPYNLSRFRVPGTWDGPRLVEELARYAPRREAFTAIKHRDSWQFVNDSQLENGVIRLPVGSFAWLRGTDYWSDVDIRAGIRLGPGARASVYVRHRGPQNYLRLSFTDQDISLQERLDRTMQTLVRHPIKKTGAQSLNFRLRVKGNRAWAWVDDVLIIQGAPLTPITSMGRIGVGAQDGQFQLQDFAATPIPEVFVLAGGYRQLPAGLQEQARAIILPWSSLASITESDRARRTEVLLAAAAGVEVIPALTTGTDPKGAAMDRRAAEVGSILGSQELKPLVTTVAVTPNDGPLIAALEKEQFHTLLMAPARQALELAPDQLRQEKGLILIDGPEAETRAALERLLHFIPASRLIVRLDSLGPLPPGVRPALKYDPRPEAAS